MSALYVRSGGRVEGPFDPAEVRRRLSAGELSLRTMSWKAGEKNWRSLAKRWPTGVALDHVLAVCGPLLVLALAVLMLGIPGRLYSSLPDAWQTQGFLAGAVGVCLACAVVLTTIMVWRGWRRRHRLSLTYAMCLMLTLMGGSASVALCVRTIGVVKAEDAFASALFHYDAATQAIQIRGMIGHRFSTDLAAMLRAHGDAARVTIDSQGGLVDQAFKAAKLIKQAQLPLRVDGMCASACSLLWAAVPHREMVVSSRIGLHQNRMIGDIPVELAVGASRQLEDESTDALSSAGFTDAMQRRRAETPPAKMYWLTAVDIINAGIQAKMLDAQGRPADMAVIKWAVVASAWGRGSLSEQLYTAIGLHERTIADTYENRLYNAFQANNMTLFHYEDRLMETDAVRQAFAQATDQAVMDFAQSRERDVAAASQDANAAECGLLNNTKDAQLADTATRTRMNEHTLIRTMALINAIPVAAGPVLPVDIRSAASDYSAYSSRIVGQLHQQGYPADVARWNSLQRCSYSNAFLQGAGQMPLARGAMIVRYGEVGRYLR